MLGNYNRTSKMAKYDSVRSAQIRRKIDRTKLCYE